ncbi:hypothetical protein SAMN05216246_10510 [Actinomyces denticolens]|uniref:Uncharacterized protein n=1 Tax=Actinomyces denticolens TaxID=52767 RepID=A0ABY1I8X0_9ACTO|nr:hypothetical protein SAMN05216246_10510 [Actinomyces denticolens]
MIGNVVVPIALNATSTTTATHSMQLTQPWTSVPSRAA